MIVGISGPPGSGKTTLAKALSERFGLEYMLTGQIFRQMAEERGMTLSDFGRYAESHPEVDIELDNLVIKRIKRAMGDERDALLEGRLAGFMLYRAKIPSFRIYITARPEVRAKRIKKREGGEISSIMRDMAERERSERERYLNLYSFDLRNMDIYDLVIDSSDMDIDTVLERATAAIEEWKA